MNPTSQEINTLEERTIVLIETLHYDLEMSANAVRKLTEELVKIEFFSHFQRLPTKKEKGLDFQITQLAKNGLDPLYIIQLRSILPMANFGSHANEAPKNMTWDKIRPSLLTICALVAKYFEKQQFVSRALGNLQRIINETSPPERRRISGRFTVFGEVWTDDSGLKRMLENNQLLLRGEDYFRNLTKSIPRWADLIANEERAITCRKKGTHNILAPKEHPLPEWEQWLYQYSHHQKSVTFQPMQSSGSQKTPLSVAQDYFGISELYPEQKDAIDQVLNKKDIVYVMPTGSGKSLVYQIVSILSRGITIVVSPLVALMEDQVQGLVSKGILATTINHTTSDEDRRERMQGILEDRYRLLYLSPELILDLRFMELLAGKTIPFLAIDEAHCISEWGHDFRTDYLKLYKIKQLLRPDSVGAFTATATDKVQSEIINLLELQSPFQIIRQQIRSELKLSVQIVPSDEERQKIVVSMVKNRNGCGIIYAERVSTVMKILDLLWIEGIRAFPYVGILDSQSKLKIGSAFRNKNIDVIVATKAFGMGIDRADVRYIIHMNTPKSIEAYFQEAGRAGRDRKTSDCILLHSDADLGLHIDRIKRLHPKFQNLKSFYDDVCNHGTHDATGHMIAIERDDFLETYSSYKETDFRHNIALCERFGFWNVHSRISNTWTLHVYEFQADKQPDFEAYVQFRREILVEQLQSMMGYVRVDPNERSDYIYKYFTQSIHR